AGQPHDIEDVGGFRFTLILLDPSDLETEPHVVRDPAVGQETEVLEDHADLPSTNPAEPLVVQEHDVFTIQQHLAGRRIVAAVQPGAFWATGSRRTPRTRSWSSKPAAPTGAGTSSSRCRPRSRSRSGAGSTTGDTSPSPSPTWAASGSTTRAARCSAARAA